VIETGPFAFSCEACGSVYMDRDRALACESIPVEEEAIPAGMLVRAVGAGANTGLGRTTASFLLGLDDPRGQVHIRLYRASFLWGRADFRREELEVLRPATDEEWRAAVARGEE